MPSLQLPGLGSSGGTSGSGDTTSSLDGGASATQSSPPSSTTSNATVDSASVLASIAQGVYQTSPDFTEVTKEPYPSAAAAGSMVLEWVSTSSLAIYELISPEVTGSNAVAPEGTTIVRAVLDEDGGIGKLTLMFKGPKGYNPALGDWWFGVTDPNGTPIEEDGGAEVGLLTGCFTCHVPRANDGYLFGVPLNDRVTAGAPGGDDAGTVTDPLDAGGNTTPDASDSGDDEDAGMDAGMDAGQRHHHF